MDAEALSVKEKPISSGIEEKGMQMRTMVLRS
jgi:hypothetical protein